MKLTKSKFFIAFGVTALFLGSCTERRRASDPVVADGDTVEVVIRTPAVSADIAPDTVPAND